MSEAEKKWENWDESQTIGDYTREGICGRNEENVIFVKLDVGPLAYRDSTTKNG